MGKRRNGRIPDVALLVETTRSYARNVLRGVGDYSRIHGPWVFHMRTDPGRPAIPSKDEWDGDGIIAQTRQNMAFVQTLVECGKPVVSLSGPPGSGRLPCVLANQPAVAQLAFNHFRDRGFSRFAYCGTPGELNWPPMGKMFAAVAQKAGFPCEMYAPALTSDRRPMLISDMAEWLRSLRTPVGLLAGNDLRAREILDACRLVEIHVPEDVAVLGVNDDELICEMAVPPLSSVIHNARRIGYEAAAMLEQLMAGKSVPADIVIDPLGVKARQSTDLLAIEDPEIAKAVRFIRENACRGICVEDVLEQVALSRRAMEKRFSLSLGRLPHMEIRRVQLERVKQLLVASDYKLDKIAEMTGFSSAQYLAGLFHKAIQMTPGEWRQASRTGNTPLQ